MLLSTCAAFRTKSKKPETSEATADQLESEKAMPKSQPWRIFAVQLRQEMSATESALQSILFNELKL